MKKYLTNLLIKKAGFKLYGCSLELEKPYTRMLTLVRYSIFNHFNVITEATTTWKFGDIKTLLILELYL
jgi:hypothetical protein